MFAVGASIAAETSAAPLPEAVGNADGARVQEKADAAFRAGKVHEAAVDYERLLSMQPNNRDARLHLAKSYEIMGRLADAEHHAGEILEKHARQVEALLLMGRVRARQGDWRGARAYFERAAAIDPGNATAQLGLGNALMRLGERGRAELAFDRFQSLTEIVNQE